MLVVTKSCSNNPHYFLRVISTMAQTEKCGRNKLQFAKPFICPVWIGVTTNIDNGNRNNIAYNHTNDRSQEYEKKGRNYFCIVDHGMTVFTECPGMRNGRPHK